MVKWVKLENQLRDKWELRYNGIIFGTIFHKPTGKFSLWFNTPVVVKKQISHANQTFTADSFDEAVQLFDSLLKERCLPWASAVVEYFTPQLLKTCEPKAEKLGDAPVVEPQ